MKKYCKILILSSLSFSLFSCSSSQNEKKEIVTIKTNETITSSSLSETISKIKPSVVDIYSYANNSTSAGSGVIIASSGDGYYVVTNHHVIVQGLSFSLRIYNDEDYKIYQGELIGTSKINDIALLKIKTTDTLECATFIEDSSKVKVGQEVIAIGNPLGILGGSVTHGIISATEREVYVENVGYMNLFQTDAAINSGNSGGALFTDEGILIGIVNSGYSSYEGLNFAIPANLVKDTISSILNTYHIDNNNYGYMVGETNLGIDIESANVFTSSSLNNQQEIYYVKTIDSNSSFDNLNIHDYYSFTQGKYQTFYCIDKINDVEVTSFDSIIKNLQVFSANDEIKITFQEIAYVRTGGFFTQNSFYITNQTYDINVTLKQYIYSI